MVNSAFVKAYRDRTGRSRQLFEEASRYLPGGDTRSVTYHRPYPTFVTSADGCYLETIDDERLLDFLNNYTQTVLGHAPESVVEAVCERFRLGNGLAAPTEEATELARLLVDRTPSVEQLRFVNSGTEATLNAIRGAIAHTERETVIKVQGGYHGTHDTVEIGVSGRGREHVGVPTPVGERVVTVPLNDTDALTAAFETHGEDAACFIIEPIMGAGGMIPATAEYLATARDLTQDAGALLIFDEVISFRLAEGGAQHRYGVTPDLTSLGKLIGGGLPVGAFGGRAEVMAQFHPERGTVDHSGTFNGNPATMVGGRATLEALDADTIDRMNELGDTLRGELESAAAEIEYPVTVTGDGSLFQIHFTNGPVIDWETSTANRETMEPLFLGLRNEGIFTAPRGLGNISAPMDEKSVDRFVEVFTQVLEQLASEKRSPDRPR